MAKFKAYGRIQRDRMRSQDKNRGRYEKGLLQAELQAARITKTENLINYYKGVAHEKHQ